MEILEDIKKEIKTENSVWNPYFDMIPARINYISTDRVCEILDKYKDKEDKYKKAWEELKKATLYDEPYDEFFDTGGKATFEEVFDIFQELEQKHEIWVE